MINYDRPRKTPYFEIYDHKFCPYCYSEMKYESGYEDYYFWEVYYCDCEGARREIILSDAVQDAEIILRGHQETRLDSLNLNKEKTLNHEIWVKKKKSELLQESVARLKKALGK